jgi:uncharacterized membrane protein YeiH
MIYALIGVALATAFGLIAYSVYGYEGLMDYSWIHSVFWWLIAMGAIVGYLEGLLRCDLCKRFGLTGLCRANPCQS